MSGSTSEYGRAGIVGLGTPQGNPTAEAEMRILLPPAAAMAVARLTSRSPCPDQRLRDYLERLEETLSQYDSLQPEAFGFACTGSSYLAEPGQEERIAGEMEKRFGYPVFTATAAIAWQLARMGARRIALVSPYPPALAEAAAAYWRGAGFAVVATERIETGSADTRSIYELASSDAAPAAAALRKRDVDIVLFSGTGLPSLRLIAEGGEGPPLLSSNLCLAMRLCAAIGAELPTVEAWRARLDLASPAPQGSSHL